jgi:hypothetical protein
VPDRARADQLHAAARALRPRCWCGCPEPSHLPPRKNQRRSCPRCGPQLCATYIPHTEHGVRVTTGHRTARYLSDMQVRTVLACISGWSMPTPPPRPAPSIPHPRRPSAVELSLRRADL